ncbi:MULTISPECIES: hypothetical protein [Streptomyces]|uniref:Uncharacterized protein n=1 Tax=Streptomyces katrae TaxID=68223 RepID=A0A0F4JUI3_9ACTN|nr:hypothetical protein [Streptomyces katrae]KJY36636.1 hypothetical protein VR44_07540 [Streptomyces katrae]MCF3182890.1 hypothetical protein [Streptomyces polychromogenes]
MGIKEQFEDKAQELKGKAQKAQQGAKEQASSRSQQAKAKKPQAQQPLDDIRDEADDSWD